MKELIQQAQVTSQKVHCEETYLLVLLLKGEELKVRKGTESIGYFLKFLQAEMAQSYDDTRALAGARTTSHRTLAGEHDSRLKKCRIMVGNVEIYTDPFFKIRHKDIVTQLLCD